MIIKGITNDWGKQETGTGNRSTICLLSLSVCFLAVKGPVVPSVSHTIEGSFQCISWLVQCCCRPLHTLEHSAGWYFLKLAIKCSYVHR